MSLANSDDAGIGRGAYILVFPAAGMVLCLIFLALEGTKQHTRGFQP